MSQNQILLDLKRLIDKDKNVYYACFPRIPASIRLDEVVFFIFVSEDGEESMAIRRVEQVNK